MKPRNSDDHLTQGIDPDKLRGIAHRIGVAMPDSRTASAMARVSGAGKRPVEDEPEDDA